MTTRFSPPLLAAVLLCAMAPPQSRGERWSAWKESPDAPFTARFEASADFRSRKFSDSDLFHFADIHQKSRFPGDIVVEVAAANPDSPDEPPAVAPGTPVVIVVEAVAVDSDHDGSPVVPHDGHYVSNPFLPFSLPSGTAEKPVVSVSVPATAPERGGSVRVPLFFPALYHRGIGSVLRVRWSVAPASGGAPFARGVLPCAFSVWKDNGRRTTVHARADGNARLPDSAAKATPLTFDSWPEIVSDIGEIAFDGSGFDAAFGEGTGRDAAEFAARARIAGVELSAVDAGGRAKLRAAGARETPDIAVPWFSIYSGGTEFQLFSSSEIGAYNGGGSADCEAFAEDERKMESARIPGGSLGRNAAAFAAATAVFLLAFAAGAVAILVRFFAFRKGEARLAVWRVLPLWAVGCTVFGLFVLPRFLDRRPYADVTEWRYGISGLGESLCIADGRMLSFRPGTAAWNAPSGASFMDPLHGHWSALAGENGGVELELGRKGGRDRFSMAPEQAGELRDICAFRFAPHDSPVSITPDPQVDPEEFAARIAAGPPERKEDAGKDAPDDFMDVLFDWTTPARIHSRVPDRTVTASENLDGVFVFARGCWYSLGPMSAGETRALDKSQIVLKGLRTFGKPYENLFSSAPFAIAASDVKTCANAWLVACGPGSRRQAACDPALDPTDEAGHSVKNLAGIFEQVDSDDGNDAAAAAAALGAMSPGKIAETAAKFGSAVVVAVKNATADDPPFLVPEFHGGPGSGKTTGRIVFMEVFP